MTVIVFVRRNKTVVRSLPLSRDTRRDLNYVVLTFLGPFAKTHLLLPCVIYSWLNNQGVV